MINRDSNNSIIRTNIVSKSVGGKIKKNKTLKKRRGGFSFFNESACDMEKENLNNKRKMLKKDARKALLNYREQFKKLLEKLKEDTRAKCKEYTSAQKDLLYQQSIQKPKKENSIFSSKLKYEGGLTTTMKNKFKKEMNHQEKKFNSQIYNIVNKLYHGGADSDYCASIIKEYQEKVIELKKNFEVLLHEYAEKNYQEPLQQARSLYNQCVLRHNEGDAEIPIVSKPNIPVHKTSNTIESDTKKLFASMISAPTYVNGKIQKPVIIAPGKSEEKKEDNKSLESRLKIAKELIDEKKQIEDTLGLPKQQQQQQQNQDCHKVEIDSKSYTEEELGKESKEKRTKLLEEFNKHLKEIDGKKDKDLNDKQKIWRKCQSKIKQILNKD
jgi:hypothetical protein